MLGLIKGYLTHKERLAVCEEQPSSSTPRSCFWRVSACDLRQRLGSADNQLNYPYGVAVGSQSRLYVADTWNHRVQVFNAMESGGLLHTLGQTGAEGSDEKHFHFPRGVAVDSKNILYVCDGENKRVCVFGASLKFVRSFGQNALKYPHSVCLNSRGQVLVSDWNLHQVVVFNKQGKKLHTIGSKGAADGQFNRPYQIAVYSHDRLFVADRSNHRIQVFDSDFKHLASFGSYTSTKEDGEFDRPTSVAVNASNTELFVGDQSHRIQVFSMRPDSTEFVFLRSFGGKYNSSEKGKFKHPNSLCFF